MSTVVPTPERWQAWSDCGCVECWAEVSAVMAALEAERDEARAMLRPMRRYLDGPASADWRAKIDAVLGEDR